jgi:hypothetical protein
MSRTITLPSGATAKLRDPESLLKKDRDKIGEISSKAESEMMKSIAMQDGFIAVSVIEWSFDLVPPSIRIASLGELTPKDYDALAFEALKAADYLFPSIDETEENKENPKADSANSND